MTLGETLRKRLAVVKNFILVRVRLHPAANRTLVRLRRSCSTVTKYEYEHENMKKEAYNRKKKQKNLVAKVHIFRKQ